VLGGYDPYGVLLGIVENQEMHTVKIPEKVFGQQLL
jgi:hypothetical protein